MTVIRIQAIGLVLLLAGACAPMPQTVSEVSRFHELGASAGGRTVAVAPTEQSRAGDLEYRDYAARIEAGLRAKGFRPPTGAGAPPDLIAFVNYGIDSGTEITTSSPRYRYRPGQYRTHTGHLHTAAGVQPYVITTYIPGRHVYAGERTTTHTVYQAFLTVDLVERASLGADPPRKLFEGRVLTKTRHALLPTVMPAMVRALFHQFPGRNGETFSLPAFDPIAK